MGTYILAFSSFYKPPAFLVLSILLHHHKFIIAIATSLITLSCASLTLLPPLYKDPCDYIGHPDNPGLSDLKVNNLIITERAL